MTNSFSLPLAAAAALLTAGTVSAQSVTVVQPCVPMDVSDGTTVAAVGKVCTVLNGVNYELTVEVTDPECTLLETHMCNMPVVSDGLEGTKSYTYSVTEEEAINWVCAAPDDVYTLAGHATIDCGEGGTSAAYYEIDLACEPDDRSLETTVAAPTTTTTPELLEVDPFPELDPALCINGPPLTAFAMVQDNNACYPSGGWDPSKTYPENRCNTCFTDVASIDYAKDYTGFNHWGWVNGAFPYVNEFYSAQGATQQETNFEIWAEAETCLPKLGALDGEAVMTWHADTGEWVIKIEPDLFNYVIHETRVYMGNEPMPLDHNGNPTVSPQFYNYQHLNLNNGAGVFFDEHRISDFDPEDGPIWVMIHISMCADGICDVNPDFCLNTGDFTTTAPFSTTGF